MSLPATKDLSPEEIAEVEARKAEAHAAKVVAERAGGPVLSKRFVLKMGEPAVDGPVVPPRTAAIREGCPRCPKPKGHTGRCIGLSNAKAPAPPPAPAPAGAGVKAVDVPAARASVDETIDHPSHYTSHPSGVECIQIAEHYGFCLGNVIKYCWRAGLKGDAVEDLKKARFYLNREIERREKSGGE